MPNEITEVEVVDMPMELSVFDPLDAQIAETARINNKNHRLAVNTKVYNAMKGIADEQSAQAIFIALRDGNIPDTTINY